MQEKVFDLVSKIPKGKITTYKELASALNSKAYRVIGSTLSKNNQLITIPCHRVVKSNGLVGDYVGGQSAKIKLLKSEGIEIKEDKVLNFSKYFFSFN